MPRVKRSVVEHNAFILLEYLVSRSSPKPRFAIVSYRTMTNDLGMSQNRVRNLVRLLVKRGYIEVHHRFAEDGGELSNAHLITKQGVAALRAYGERLRQESHRERVEEL